MKKYLITSFVIVFGLLLANTNIAEASPQYPTVSISASPNTVAYNGTSVISWSATNATSCVGSEGSAGWATNLNPNSGSFSASGLTNTSVFKIKCGNAYYFAGADVTVSVGQAPSGGGGCGTGCGGSCGSGCGYTPPPTVSIIANPSQITYGNSSNLTWTSQNATNCVATTSQGYSWYGNLGPSGSQTVSPKNTTTYGITCSNYKGQTASSSATVNVVQGCGNNCGGNYNGCGNNCGGNYYNGCGNNCGGYTPPAPIITSFYANQTSINRGDSTVLYWTSQNASNCMADNALYGNWFGSLGTSGSVTVRPNTTTTYNLSCSNSIGQRASSNLTISVNNIDYNTYLTVNTNSASNVTENSATLYGYVTSNNSNYSNTTRWFEYGTSYGNLYSRTNTTYGEGTYSQAIFGLSPNTTYYFRAVAQGNNGTVYGNTQNFTTQGGYTSTCGNGISCPPTAVTNGVSLVGTSSAQLNGAGLQDGVSVQMNGYFEWGTTENFGNSTNTGSIGSSRTNNFYSTIYGLSSDTRYFYRAVVTNGYGTSRGTTRSFVTRSITTTTPPVVVRPPVVNPPVVVTNAVPSSIFLDVDRDDGIIRTGDTIDYTVTWRNISSTTLSNVVIHVLVPNELEFIRSTKGDLSEDNRYVVLTLGTLAPGEQGSLILTTRVRTQTDIGSTVVVTAEAEYTLPNGAQEQAFAYSKNTVENGSGVGLAGLALFGNGFWPSTLIGWLLLLLIILIIVWIARMVYTRTTNQRVAPHHPVPPAPQNHNTPWNTHS